MRVLVASLLLLGGLAAAHQGKGSRPQSLGLPDELPADLVERDGYVLFDGVPGLNGPPSNGPARFTPEDVTRSDVFDEDHGALLPPVPRRAQPAGVSVSGQGARGSVRLRPRQPVDADPVGPRVPGETRLLAVRELSPAARLNG